jgi:hypothetical protein
MKRAAVLSLFVLSLCLFSPFSSSAGGPPVDRLSPRIEYGGGLDIRLHPANGKLLPSADTLLIFPDGSKIGSDIAEGVVYFGTGGSYFEYEGLEDAETGKPGPSSRVIFVTSPPDGNYTLRVTGLEDGRYSIEANAYGMNNKSSHAELMDVPIEKGEVREYLFRYSNAGMPALELKKK